MKYTVRKQPCPMCREDPMWIVYDRDGRAVSCQTDWRRAVCIAAERANATRQPGTGVQQVQPTNTLTRGTTKHD